MGAVRVAFLVAVPTLVTVSVTSTVVRAWLPVRFEPNLEPISRPANRKRTIATYMRVLLVFSDIELAQIPKFRISVFPIQLEQFVIGTWRLSEEYSYMYVHSLNLGGFEGEGFP